MIQLDLLDEHQIISLAREIQSLKDQSEKVRKSLFAKYGELSKDMKEIKEKINFVPEENLSVTGSAIPVLQGPIQ